MNDQVVLLAEVLEKQKAAIEEIQAKLAKNSSNSGKPPSSYGYGKKKVEKRTESQRKKKQKPTEGHTGTTLKSVPVIPISGMFNNSAGRENVSFGIFSIRIGKLDAVFAGAGLYILYHP